MNMIDIVYHWDDILIIDIDPKITFCEPTYGNDFDYDIHPKNTFCESTYGNDLDEYSHFTH